MFAEEAAGEAAHAAAGWFLEHAWLIPVIPAVAFFLIIFFGKKMPKGGSEIGILAMVASLVIAAGTAYQWIDWSHHSEEPIIKSITWWQSGGLKFGIGQHIDGLAVMALLLVSFISTLVQIYSTEYVRGDRRYTHFFASLTLFSAGMLSMVLAPNMVQFILGWEIMGLCSFMLIGHWWEEEANSRAALRRSSRCAPATWACSSARRCCSPSSARSTSAVRAASTASSRTASSTARTC
jgi:NADH-quinone oxidoreductase subunit L